MAAPLANWSAFKFQVPGKDYLGKIRNILETLLIYLDIAKAVLETIKAFLIDFGNPIRALVEALVKLVRDLFEALKRTGLYAYYDVPNPLNDPSAKDHLGGFQAFTLRFKGSLADATDMNRPQPVKGALKGGFILICVDAEGPMGLYQSILSLLKFFGRDFIQPRFQAPANLKVIPVGEKGDPILSVTKIFQNQVQAIALEWTLPTATPSGDPGFSGLASHLGQELVPPKWLIERAEIPLTQEIVIDPNRTGGFDNALLQTTANAGPVMMNVVTTFTDPRNVTTPVFRKQPVVDQYGDPVIKFNTAAVLGYGSASFIMGQLGTFRFIDTGVDYDKAYFYRVRAFSGPLDIDEKTGIIKFHGPLEKDGNQAGKLYLKWPSTDPKTPVVVGRASPVMRVKLAKLPAKFDVMAVLRAVFLTAFSLNFQLPVPQGEPILDSEGQPVLDKDDNPTYKAVFDDKGNPQDPYDVTIIGWGTLVEQAGFILGLAMLPTVDSYSPAIDYGPSPVTGDAPEQPWQSKSMRFQAAKLADRFGSLLLNNGSSAIEAFRALMQGPLPKGTIKTKWPDIGQPKTLEQLVLAFTRVTFKDQSTLSKVASAIAEINPTGTVSLETARAYGDAYKEEAVRRNMMVAVDYLKVMGFGGVPPNWLQVSILRDIIPWSGQILYDILAKMQALLDAFKGVMDEIKTFIDVLVRKINAIEDFIRYLISILDFIANLSIGAFVLAVPEIDGDLPDWIAAIDNAGGDKPSSGPGGYSGGIGLAYLAADITAFSNAFKLIF